MGKKGTPLWKAVLFEGRLPWRYQEKLDEIRKKLAIKCVHGPKKIKYDMDEIIVVCLVRDGELYIKSFIDHYFSLGVKHIVFLDNNSKDRTVSIASKYKNVTVLKTKLSYKENQFFFKDYLVRRFAKNRWSIYADIDELFDYPFSDVISISSLIEYLNKNSYTAVVSYILDMFSDKPLSSFKSKIGDSLKDTYPYYDLSHIEKREYLAEGNIVSNKKIKTYYGGIRKILFNSNTYLWTHRMVFLDDKLKPHVRSHRVRNSHMADFTCAVPHYKFLSSFYDQTIKAIKEGNYCEDSVEYKKYFKILKQNPNLNIMQKTSKKLKSVNQLVDDGFLVVSKNYLKLLDKERKKMQKTNT